MSKDYPIFKLDGGFVISENNRPFETVTELIEYFKITRSNGKSQSLKS